MKKEEITEGRKAGTAIKTKPLPPSLAQGLDPPLSQKITRNEKVEMRAWVEMHGKSVRQRNVRRDNTMDGGRGTSPLNLYETTTVLKTVNLNLLKGVERVPRESNKPPNSDKDASSPPESPKNE